MSASAPYVGLDYFGEEDADLFFGRDAERKQILGNLRASRLTLLYAESGVGKSSLLRAGVSARLRHLAARSVAERGSARYVPVVFNAWQGDAKDDLITALEGALRPLLREPEQLTLRRDGLEGAIEDAVAAVDAAPLIILDQFEEHFLYDTDEGEFDDELARCVNRPDLRAHFLISIRDEAYSLIGSRFKSRIPNVYGNYLHLDFLDAQAARDAVLEPVNAFNGRLPADAPRFDVEPALVDAVLDQVRRGRVNLGDAGAPEVGATGPARVETAYLQLVMKRLWEEEVATGSGRLRLETLQRLGGAETIVRGHLDDVMAKLSEEQRDAAAAAFRFLVTSGGRKIALSSEELSEFSGVAATAMEPALGQLERQRILRPIASSEPGGVARHELYHDVLAPATLDWQLRHETQREAHKLAALAKEEARRRWLRRLRLSGLVIGSAVVAVIAILAILAWQQRGEARKQSRIATSRELAATSRTQLDTDPELSILLAEEALRRRKTDEAVGALRAALATDRSLGVLSAGRKTVRGVDATRDGTRLLAFGDDGHMRVWRLSDHRRLLDVRASPSPVTDARFSPDGRRIVSAARDGSIVVWDAENGRRLLTLRQHGPRGARPRWAPNGRQILASTARYVTIWSASTGQRLQNLRSPRGTIEAAQWQPHHRTHILTAAAGHPSSHSHEWNDDGIARLWDARSGTVVASRDTTYPLRDAFFDDQGRAAVTIPQFGAAHVWYPKSGRAVVLRSRGAPTWPVVDATFNHAGERIATTTTNERNVRIWDARTGAVDAVLTGHASHVTAIEFSPDDSTVATASNDRSARTWDARTGDLLSVLRGHDSRISGLAFPTADLIATAGTDGYVRLWRTGAKQLASLKLQAFGDVSFSHDGRLVVAATYNGVEIRRWEPDAARPLVMREPGGVNTASLSPDGHFVVVTGFWSRPSAPARVLHVPDGRISGRPLAAGPGNGAVTAGFSPDGQVILTGHRDGAARLWSSHSHRLLRQFGASSPPSDRTTLRDAQFSSDGRRIVTIGATGAARVFDTASGQRLQSLSSPRGEPGGDFHAAAFQPGGATLATIGSDGLALLWNLQTGESRALPADDSVNGVAFSPDGAVLATSSWDGTARLWTATGYPLGPLQRARQAVMSVAFSRDGRRLVTADDTDVVRVFECEVCGSIDDLQRTARARVSRGLTRQERRDYVGAAGG